VARVLFLTQVLPYPLNTGAKVRQYYVLRYLSRQHEVTLASFVRPDDRPEHVAHLREYCAGVHTVPIIRSRVRDVRALLKGLVANEPNVIARDDDAAMRNLVSGLLARGRFDVVHADQVSMAQYGLLGRGPRRVLDLHNALYLVVERLAAHEPNPLKRALARREARALAQYEAGLCRRFDQVVFVSGEDRQAIERQIANGRLATNGHGFSTIPICVDPRDRPQVELVARPHRVLALGAMFWQPNAEGALWFARSVWPLIRASCPEACFTVVGKNPPPALRALDGRDGIEVLGYVDELDRLLTETAVFVVPLRAGGGMRVKILEAWCWALPIVSTTIGAEGLAVRNGENILLADEPAAFARAVVNILECPETASTLRGTGRRWVESTYDYRAVYTAWDEVYSRCSSDDRG
jgi:glycosyltransferase involved in cell wall biosynthesis